ncbi:MAG: hypothetical protein WC155_02990 [Candidatus Cloacimonadales bacterium]
MRHGLYRVGKFFSSISIVAKVTFGGTFILTYILYSGSSIMYSGILVPLAVAFLATFIVEIIYSMFRNKSNLP